MSERNREMLAEYDQHLRLVTLSDVDGSQSFVIEIVDDDGGVEDSTHFAHHDFPLAANDYAWRIVNSLGPSTRPAVETALRMLIAVQRFDGETLAGLLHEDFVQVDHRPIGYPELDRAGMLDAVLAQDSPQVWLNQTLHAASATASVSTGSFWTLNFGHWSPFEQGVYTGLMDDGLMTWNEVFPEDQLDAALARFAEMTASPDASA